MENKIVTFNPIGDIEKIYQLEDLIHKIVEGVNETGVNVDVTELNNELTRKVDKFKKEYNEVVEYISKFWGKYVHIKFSYNVNYTETRETQPEWFCDYEANVLLYRYVPENNSLFGMYNKLNDMFSAGVYDNSINLLDKMQDHKLEINEITEEEYMEKVNESTFKCLLGRLNKIESGNYKLTEYGYQNELKKDIKD